MDHQGCAQLDGAAQERRGRCVVDDQRHTGGIGDVGDRAHVHDVAAGVRDRLAKDGAGVVVDGRRDRVQIVEVDELAFPAKAFDRMAELRDRPAVKPC